MTTSKSHNHEFFPQRWIPGRAEADRKEHGEMVGQIKSLLQFCEISYPMLAEQIGVNVHRIENAICRNQAYLTLAEKNQILDIILRVLAADARAQTEYADELQQDLDFCNQLQTWAREGRRISTGPSKDFALFQRIRQLYLTLVDESGQKLWRGFSHSRETLSRIMKRAQKFITPAQLESFGRMFSEPLDRDLKAVQARQSEILERQRTADSLRSRIPEYVATPNHQAQAVCPSPVQRSRPA